MKLFVIAALIAVAAAGRLEHLERSYLPPNSGVNVARSNMGSGFGSNGFGSASANGAFGSNGRSSLGGQPSQYYGAAAVGQARSTAGAFPSATFNQYLPPNQASAYNNAPRIGSASQSGFGGRNAGAPMQAFDEETGYQYDAPSSQYGTPSDSSSSQSMYEPQQFGSSPQQFGSSPQQFGTSGLGQFGRRGQPGSINEQFASASRQYLAPNAGSSQNYPQQAFDEETGYQY